MDAWLRTHISDPTWLGTWVEPGDCQPARFPQVLIENALSNPIGAVQLETLIGPGCRIAVIVDDFTRQTPARLLLEVLLPRLARLGVSHQDLRLVIASGSHRRMTQGELIAKLGCEVVANYQVIQTAECEAQDWVYMGTASSGIPAWVHPGVVQADLRIGLGMVTPHMDAGFSGGAKLILPGVCGPQTVDAFHALAADDPVNPLGNPEAPLRLALEAFVQENVPLDWIVNLVLTPRGEVFGCVAGHPVLAQRAGALLACQVFGAHVARRYPVVVADCAPYQHDLWQSLKGLWCGDLLVEDGGSLIWVTRAPEGLGGYPHLAQDIGSQPQALRACLAAGLAVDPKSAASGVLVGLMKCRFRLVLVSPGLSAAQAQVMGVSYHQTVGSAIQEAVALLPPHHQPACLAVVPQAGVTLPLFSASGE